MSDGLEFISRENAPNLTGLRELTMRMNETESASASPGLSGAEGTNPFGGYKRLYSDYILSSSGNTITCGASDSKLVSIYAEGVGWVDKTIESDITLSTVGFTNGKLHDIFINFNQDDAGILSAVEWTNETTRATTLDTVDGVKLKNGDNTYRYLSTGRYNGSTMMLPKDDPNGEKFYGTGDPRNNTVDPATGVGMYAGGVSLGGTVYNFFSILNGVVGFGVDLLGNLVAIAGGFKLNASGMSLTVSGNLVMSITAAYALFGSNVAAANTTAFAIFFTAQTYNSESMEAGSVLFGSNSATYANVLWRPSTKQLQFRAATTVQAYVDTDGAIKAGAGVVGLDANGISVATSTSPSSVASYKFTDSILGMVSDIASYLNAGVNWIVFTVESITGYDANLYIRAFSPSGKTSQIRLQTFDNGSLKSQVQLTSTGINITNPINESQGANIASAATTDIGAATGNYINITGTTTITALGTVQAGTRRIVQFTGALTLTYNATSLILPGAANITTAAGDMAEFVSEGSGNWRCTRYTRAAATPATGTNTGDQTIKSIIGSNYGAQTIAASTTLYLAPYSSITSASSANVAFPVAFAGTIKNLYVRSATTQPASGSFVVTVYKNGVAQTLTLTIAAGGAAGTYSDLVNNFSVVAGDRLAFELKNNATGASAGIAGISVELDG